MRAMRYPHAHAEGGFVSISVGLASAVSDDLVRPVGLVRRAGNALYDAWAGGRNCHSLFGGG